MYLFLFQVYTKCLIDDEINDSIEHFEQIWLASSVHVRLRERLRETARAPIECQMRRDDSLLPKMCLFSNICISDFCL